jgi:hypothetical protein
MFHDCQDCYLNVQCHSCVHGALLLLLLVKHVPVLQLSAQLGLNARHF